MPDSAPNVLEPACTVPAGRTRLSLRAGRAATAAFFMALFALYVAMRPLCLHVSDSYAWVNTVEQSAFGHFLHPHHLLYIPLAWRWNEIVQALAPGVSTWASLATLSAIFGCAGVAGLYLTLRVLGAARGAALAAASAMAFTFGYWFFSSDAEVYVFSAACALWTLYFLARVAAGGNAAAAWWAGVAAGIAALFHQTGIFLFVPAAVVLLSLKRDAKPLRHAALFTLGFGVIVAPAYLAAAWAVLPRLTPASFVGWIFLYGGKGYGGFTLSGVLLAPVGLARALVGGQAVLDLLRGARPAGTLLLPGLAAAALAVGLSASLAASALARARRLRGRASALALAALAAFGAYGLFSVYFDSANFEWWAIALPLLMTAAFVPLVKGPRPAVMRITALALALFLANLCLDFDWRRRPENDFLLAASREVSAAAGAADVVIAPSHLGARLWYEDRGTLVICPDDLLRTAGAAGVREALLAAAQAAGDKGRFLLAAVECNAVTAAFAGEAVARALPGETRVAGHIRYFDGGRRFVDTVGPVPVVAVDAAAVARSFEAARVAGAPANTAPGPARESP